MPTVPRIELERPWVPARLHQSCCLECPHPVSAASFEGLHAAMQSHADYVNKLNVADDPHFAENRLDALL